MERKVDKREESSGEEVSVKVGRAPCLRVVDVVENCRCRLEKAWMRWRQERQIDGGGPGGMFSIKWAKSLR